MYANIERELLATVWGVQKFHTYVYRHRAIVETDDKLLESIFFVVRYFPGKLQVISDCLSRAPLSETEPFSEPEDVVGTNLVEELGLESITLSVEHGMLFK